MFKTILIEEAIPYRQQLIGLLDLHIRMEVNPWNPDGPKEIENRIKHEFSKEVAKYILVKEVKHIPSDNPVLEGVLNLPLIKDNHVKTLDRRINMLENDKDRLLRERAYNIRKLNHYNEWIHTPVYKKLWMLFFNPVEYENRKYFK